MFALYLLAIAAAVVAAHLLTLDGWCDIRKMGFFTGIPAYAYLIDFMDVPRDNVGLVAVVGGSIMVCSLLHFLVHHDMNKGVV